MSYLLSLANDPMTCSTDELQQMYNEAKAKAPSADRAGHYAKIVRIIEQVAATRGYTIVQILDPIVLENWYRFDAYNITRANQGLCLFCDNSIDLDRTYTPEDYWCSSCQDEGMVQDE